MTIQTARRRFDEFLQVALAGCADSHLNAAMECIDEIVSEAKTAAARDVALTMARTYVARYLEIVRDVAKWS